MVNQCISMHLQHHKLGYQIKIELHLSLLTSWNPQPYLGYPFLKKTSNSQSKVQKDKLKFSKI